MPPPPRSNRAFRVVARILRPLLLAITRRDWRGVENIPRDRGVIVASNHMTNIDPLTFAHFLWDNGFVPKILAKASLFSVPVVGKVLRATGQIPVHRNTAAAGESLQEAIAAIADGDCVAVFPEGTLTRDPDLWPMVGKTGVARLALSTRAPVVPVAQWGPQDLLGRYKKLFKPIPPKKVTIVAGPPVVLDDLYDRPQDTATLREATERVVTAITVLLEEIRGERAPAVRYDMRKAAARERQGEAGGTAGGAGTATGPEQR
ncbi:lysophospholipid acyltransferase family protein [Cellulomonas biazotea]|uniref:1-acyl-sn-glycerol-3-phosphate acyltransferase n=1 Tax=Cellulomonas biazotea TaxID=1709 RepID=A0A402DLT6_9CELL|nr:lysophospholipid acyltransferase family protein [Cellulomonas biazotea]GCE75094.1 1-acyl-sn-glycerol-3-phosphate acyltransferase [Cellulomonas biazotea]